MGFFMPHPRPPSASAGGTELDRSALERAGAYRHTRAHSGDMEWAAILYFAGIGYVTAGIAGGLALSIERQPEHSPVAVGALKTIGVGIGLLALGFALVLTGDGLLALV